MQARILMIDDEPEWCSCIKLGLSMKGYDVTTAESGEEGLALLQNGPSSYDAVLLDLMMLRMGGLDVLREMRKDAAFSSLPVILQTGSSDPEAIGNAIMLGAALILQKPFDRTQLLQALEKVLQR